MQPLYRLSLGLLAVCALLQFTIGLPLSTVSAAELTVEELVVKTAAGDHSFQVELAQTDVQRAKGLMFREEMSEDEGMLFIFEGEGERYFWMKNTPLPLDIIFVATDGRIVSIAESTTPFSEAIVSSNGPARYVLEVLAGTSEKLGFSTGDFVQSPSMK